MQRILIASLLALLTLLAACQSPRSGTTTARTESIDPFEKYADVKGRQYALDASRSSVRAHVFRSGRLAKLGHNHIISMPELEGRLLIRERSPPDLDFDLRVRLDRLKVDDPRWIDQLGGSFASERSESAVAGTRKNMLGEKVLNAARYPTLHLSALGIRGGWPLLIIDTAIRMHGKRVETPVVASVFEEDGGAIRVRGNLLLKQSDFGIEPFSALAGALAVQDEIVIVFDLLGRQVPQP